MTSSSSDAGLFRALLDETSDALLAVDLDGAIIESNAAAAAIPHLAELVAGADVREAIAALGPGGRSTLTVTHDDDRWQVSLHRLELPSSVAVVSLTQHEGGTQLTRLVLRLPFGVLGLRPDLTVASANARARTLLGPAAVRSGAPLRGELRTLAQQLAEGGAPLPAAEVRLEDGRTLQVAGVARSGRDPAVLFFDDATERERGQRATREFVRNAAHQLRTPLAGIVAAVETLQAGAKEEPASRDRFLGHIEAHADRLTRLSRALLQLARLDTGEPAAVGPVELASLLAAVAAEAQPCEGVKLTTSCPPRLAALAAPDLLQEALATLVDNAVSHTREGEIRLTAAAEGPHVVVRVTDTGPGIPRAYRERVFEPFFQVAPSAERYGLGLTIARQAVRAIGGEIGVSSSSGAGTVFTVHLPAATGAP